MEKGNTEHKPEGTVSKISEGTVKTCEGLGSGKLGDVCTSEEKYRKMVMATQEGITVIDGEGFICFANETMARWLGCRLEEMLGKPVLEFYFPEDRAKARDRLQERKANISERYDTKLRKINGDHLWCSVSGTSLQDQQGNFIAIIALFMDITQRKREEEELKALRNNLAAEVEALTRLHTLCKSFVTPDNPQNKYEEILDAGIELTKADRGYIALYEADVGYHKVMAQRGFRDANLFQFKPQESQSGWSIATQAYHSRQRVIVENIAELVHESGFQELLELGITSLQSTPLISSSGKVLGTLTTQYQRSHVFSERELRMLDLLSRHGADLVERKRAEEAILQSEKRAQALVEELRKKDENKNQFLSALSHELRNPLASIKMSLALLRQVDPQSGQARQAFEILERQSTHLTELVDDLLDITRITRNMIHLKKEPVDINDLVSKTVADYKELFQRKGAGLSLEPTQGRMCIEADPLRLTQALGNLLHNAAKFSAEGGQTQVRVWTDEGARDAVIEVQDDGVGIRPDILPDLFLPFVQVDNSLGRSGGGLGLGLAIVKGIMDIHGGSVCALSEGLGKGTTFLLRLPLPEVLEVRWERSGVEENPPMRNLRILVIDDLPDVAEILSALLRVMGHEVVTAGSGREGIAVARDYRPEVILCDIGLPDLSGYEVARSLQADPDLNRIFLIAISGYAQPTDVERAIAAGFHRHVAKPVDFSILSKVLAEYRRSIEG